MASAVSSAAWGVTYGMPIVRFESLPDSARLWVFASDQPLSGVQRTLALDDGRRADAPALNGWQPAGGVVNDPLLSFPGGAQDGLPVGKTVSGPPGVALEDIEAALAEHGRLIAKPTRDGSSYGLLFVNSTQDLVAVRQAAKTEDYVIEPFIAGTEATCGVLEQLDGSLTALPPI